MAHPFLAPARLLALPSLLMLGACSSEPPEAPAPPAALDPPRPPDPLSGVVRQYATSCRLLGAPAPPPKLKLTRVLSAATIASPVDMVPAGDGSRRVFIVAQRGVIYVAEDVKKDGSAAIWLDLRDRVSAGGEMGLLSLALDPQFRTTGRLYVNYTSRQAGRTQTRVSRFRVPMPPAGAPDPMSEQVLLTINQPYDNHNGGQVAFGPDGYLYVGMGDGGSGGDPVNAGQRMDTLLGKFLRLDVSGAGATYRIPADNPFFKGQALADGTGANNSHCSSGVAGPGVCGEIWALGLRNPWRFSFDPLDGALWTGDVGQGAREEVDIIERGKNYGWRCMEGTSVYNDDQSCKDKRAARAFTEPVHEYPRTDGKSISGGHVYRGRALPGLQGSYIFADYVSGTVWALSPGTGGTWTRSTLFSEVGFISGFGLDEGGELYVLQYGDGQLLRIEAAEPGQVGQAGWPERLSDTGCFADLRKRRLVPGALSYGVNAPLWSDGSQKERALVLPLDGTLRYRERGTFELPAGSILIKTFVLGEVPVETRFLVWEGGAVRGATYRWNGEHSDGVLLSAGLTARVGAQDWPFPSRSECTGCHTKAASGVLGLSTAQMNRGHDVFGTGVVPQIDALAQIGYLAAVPGLAAALPRFPEPGDERADRTERARAYLDANCAHCHQPGGLSNATLDLRAITPLKETKACDVLAQQGDLGVRGARILSPGKPAESTLWLRMNTLDPATRMPNFGSLVRDEQGVALVRAWIEGLAACP